MVVRSIVTSAFRCLGALGALVLGGLTVAAWQLDAGFGPVLWSRASVLVCCATLLSAASASGWLAVARTAEEQELLDPGADEAQVGLAGAGEQELLRGRG